MKSKLLFTAALMSAASLASQETYEAKGIVTDKSAYEYAMGRLLADAEDGQVDVVWMGDAECQDVHTECRNV